MGNGKHYDSYNAGPEWGTPVWIVNPLADSVGGFDLDPASGAEPEPYAETRWTVEDDGLSHRWFGDVWLNPPYGRKYNSTWAEKVTSEIDNVDTLTALVPASTSTDWWQNHYARADILTWIDTRIQFHGAGDSGASFASVLCSWVDDPPNVYIRTLEDLGTVTYTDPNA